MLFVLKSLHICQQNINGNLFGLYIELQVNVGKGYMDYNVSVNSFFRGINGSLCLLIISVANSCCALDGILDHFHGGEIDHVRPGQAFDGERDLFRFGNC